MSNIHRIKINIAAACLLALASGCGDAEKRGDYIGYVEAEYVYVAPPEAGWLVDSRIREGDMVAIGETLFELDKERQEAAFAAADARAAEAGAMAENIRTGARPQEIQRLKAQLSEAKAALKLATAERDRWLPLVVDGNASKAKGDQVVADYEAALARVNAAKEEIAIAELGGREAEKEAAGAATLAAIADRAEAEWRLDERTVTAKVAGRVEEIFHREGEFVAAGAAVAAILPENGVKIRFFVPQADLPKFSIDAPVSLYADGLDAPVEARITHIAMEAEFTPPVIYSAESRDKLVFLIEAKPLNPEGLRPGLPVEVSTP